LASQLRIQRHHAQARGQSPGKRIARRENKKNTQIEDRLNGIGPFQVAVTENGVGIGVDFLVFEQLSLVIDVFAETINDEICYQLMVGSIIDCMRILRSIWRLGIHGLMIGITKDRLSQPWDSRLHCKF